MRRILTIIIKNKTLAEKIELKISLHQKERKKKKITGVSSPASLRYRSNLAMVNPGSPVTTVVVGKESHLEGS